jgi:hypothetical protein
MFLFRNEMVVRNDGLTVEYLPAVQPTHRVDICIRNNDVVGDVDGEDATQYLPSSRVESVDICIRSDGVDGDGDDATQYIPASRVESNSSSDFIPSSQPLQPSQRVEMGVRSNSLSPDFIPNTQRVESGVRGNNLPPDFIPTSQPSHREGIIARAEEHPNFISASGVVGTDGISGSEYLPTSHRTDIEVRNDEYLPTTHRTDIKVNDGIFPTSHRSARTDIASPNDDYLPTSHRTVIKVNDEFLPSSHQSDIEVRNDEYLPTAHRNDIESRNDDYLPTSHRNDIQSSNNEYLPTSQRTGIESRNDEYLPTSHDVPFEAMVDYDTLDSHDFIVPDVPTPPAAPESDLESESKFFATRNFQSLVDSGNGNECPVLQHQPQPEQEEVKPTCRFETTESDNKDLDDLVNVQSKFDHSN